MPAFGVPKLALARGLAGTAEGQEWLAAEECLGAGAAGSGVLQHHKLSALATGLTGVVRRDPKNDEEA